MFSPWVFLNRRAKIWENPFFTSPPTYTENSSETNKTKNYYFFFLQNIRHIICDFFFWSYFQIEIISLLSVDHDDVTLRNSSQNTLKNLLLQLENDKKDDVHSGPPMWVVDLAQSKIFETSKLLCDSGYIENLFHESKTLEKHLATVHGFLWLLKSIERAR